MIRVWVAMAGLLAMAGVASAQVPPLIAEKVRAAGHSMDPASGGDYAKRYIEADYGYNPELAAKRLATLPATDKAVEAAIKRQADMGVDEFILRPCADDLDQMERLAEIAGRVAEL